MRDSGSGNDRRFADRNEAEEAVRALVEAGVPRGALTLREAAGEVGEDVPLVRVTGAHRIALWSGVAGTVGGMVLGLLVGLGVVNHPLLGFLEPGPLGGLLKGAIGGAGFGTLFGYILGMGLWDDDGEVSTVASEGVLLAVPPEHEAVARRVLAE